MHPSKLFVEKADDKSRNASPEMGEMPDLTLDSKEMLEDLVVAAFNDAKAKADQDRAEQEVMLDPDDERREGRRPVAIAPPKACSPPSTASWSGAIRRGTTATSSRTTSSRRRTT